MIRTRKGGRRTLAIDIGGTGLKAMLLGGRTPTLSDRVRVPTPRPATPKAVMGAILRLVQGIGPFGSVSVGFPGVVIDGVVHTAPNLHPSWRGYHFERKLEQALKRPTRVLNDAGMQGHGVVEGTGLEMVITLGTGMGTALFLDGKYIPNLELAHHPFRHGKTYEEYVGARALAKVGKRKWNRRVARVVAQVLPVWNPRRLYLGGGNSKHVRIKLPPDVVLTSNLAGLTGGLALWAEPKPPRRA
jgi:polyphosphate glucokinase